MIYTSYDMFRCKDLAFGGKGDAAPYFRGQMPPKHQFWDGNSHFQAKHAKYSNFHEKIEKKIISDVADNKQVESAGLKINELMALAAFPNANHDPDSPYTINSCSL